MNSATLPILVAILVQLALGVVVFLANRHLKSNQTFLLLSVGGAAWLGCVFYASTAANPQQATFWIRQASAAALVNLAGFNFLRLSIRERQSSWGTIVRQSALWILLTIAAVAFCQTHWFLKGAHFSPVLGGAAPKPDYNHPGVYIYGTYFILTIVAIVVATLRDLRTTGGAVRSELGFILLGGLCTVAFSVLLSVILGYFVEPARLLWFAPLRVVLFSAIVAYGIVTQKMMEVGLLLRRLISYALLATYLLVLYAVVWWLVVTALQSSIPNAHTMAHITAAIAIAFAMAPARGVSQRLAERLFIGSQSLDFRATVSKATKILASVATLRDLLDRFAQTVAEAVGTERVYILLPDRHGFFQRYPAVEPGARFCLELSRDQATIAELETNREPIVMDELGRARPTPQLQRVMRQLDSLQIALAMGIFSRDHLAGVLLLGARKSGRIYGATEQGALQVLCGQLAVAIENAELFTEVQNAKIYNETLLENLTSGVIAAGTDDRITVFNNEAGQITGLGPQDLLDGSLSSLPPDLAEPLIKTLRSGERQENWEIALEVDNGERIIRASTSIFHGQDRQVLGALMVLTDITAIKRLEHQIRRSDRLASLGTLSAGMAHEIKNPLVSLKTFAQLLPERYQDSDFRDTFSNLIGHEIDRIDSLVNQLLRFARPAKPILKPLHAHEVLEKALTLVGHRLYQKDIKLTRSWNAEADTIHGDADQLEQVFLNFFLNAMDAMKTQGELSVQTEVRGDEQWVNAKAYGNGERNGHGRPEALRITIRDTGEGIRAEDLPHVFDPFFTTKDYGTGLGLSVVHGIIQEHGGQIEVESELQKGTAFHILFPLVRAESKVAAA
ncbi:MAG TPA: ATP-binding protein [Chthoniobacterales bacterium]|jgi:PAS domain S-box-containing protein|nr:ATP-binding protein [Chthoniobacterales bacterium]